MPALAAMLLTIVTEFVAWLAKFLTQKVALALVIVAVCGALFVALYASLSAVISAGVTSLDGVHPMFGVGLSMVISQHSAALFSSYITFWMLVELYKWKVSLVAVWSRTS